eukprot:jgi/Chrzof1/11882/Cz06g13130.t1
MSAGDYHRLKDYSDAEDGIVNRARDSPTEWTTSSSTEPVLIPSKQHKTLSYRQKKGRRMTWLILHQNGEQQTVQMDKRQLIQVMGLEIPMRDLRLMDPALQAWDTYAQILVRDNAMVFSVEHARLIIAADKVLVPMDFDRTQSVNQLIKALEGVIRERAADELSRGGSAEQGELHRHHSGQLKDIEVLPFELSMLEVALGEVCRHLQKQVSALESVAHPALDALTKGQDTVNLERVRKIKTQHQRLTGRVQTLKEVLERYMEDDQDMWRMCLSRRKEQDVGNVGSDNTLMLNRMAHATVVKTRHSSLPKHQSPPSFMERLTSKNTDHHSDSTSTTDDYHDLLEVENLLESYYMIVDSTHGKLASIGEYIDDTEDYVNIELDYSRNRLLRIEILLTIATFSLAVYNLVAGVLGENLVLPDAITRDIRGFIIINVSTTVFVVSAFVLIWRIMRKKKLV